MKINENRKSRQVVWSFAVDTQEMLHDWIDAWLLAKNITEKQEHSFESPSPGHMSITSEHRSVQIDK